MKKWRIKRKNKENFKNQKNTKIHFFFFIQYTIIYCFLYILYILCSINIHRYLIHICFSKETKKKNNKQKKNSVLKILPIFLLMPKF